MENKRAQKNKKRQRIKKRSGHQISRYLKKKENDRSIATPLEQKAGL